MVAFRGNYRSCKIYVDFSEKEVIIAVQKLCNHIFEAEDNSDEAQHIVNFWKIHFKNVHYFSKPSLSLFS